MRLFSVNDRILHNFNPLTCMDGKRSLMGFEPERSHDNLPVVRQEVETFTLFQDDNLSDHISDEDCGLPVQGVFIRKLYWSEEDTYCFQLEFDQHKICRRADTHFINATKLMKVCSITRGRRDGLLRSEKIRYVIREGQMDLKGVWIPFERAKHLAIVEGIYKKVRN